MGKQQHREPMFQCWVFFEDPEDPEYLFSNIQVKATFPDSFNSRFDIHTIYQMRTNTKKKKKKEKEKEKYEKDIGKL